jgi:Ulp1 family protease
LASFLGFKFNRDDARRLRPKGWLNDTCMGLFLALLATRHNDLRRTLPQLLQIHVFEPLFWPKLCPGQGTYVYDSVKTWTKNSRLSVDIFACSCVIVPINIVDSHWLLGIIFPQKRAIAIIDSFADHGGVSGHDHFFDIILRYVKDEHLDKKGVALDTEPWSRITIPSPRQYNGYDCGVHVLINADLILAGESLNYSTEIITQFRRYVALCCLLSGSPAGDGDHGGSDSDSETGFVEL